MARAAGMGLCVCKPYGDSAQYDVGIEDGGRLLRVQIKSTTYSRDGSFTCNVIGRGRKGYVAGVVDFFAMSSIPRLLDKQLIRLVAEFEEGHAAYSFTPLGKVVAQHVKANLNRLKADPPSRSSTGRSSP